MHTHSYTVHTYPSLFLYHLWCNTLASLPVIFLSMTRQVTPHLGISKHLLFSSGKDIVNGRVKSLVLASSRWIKVSKEQQLTISFTWSLRLLICTHTHTQWLVTCGIFLLTNEAVNVCPNQGGWGVWCVRPQSPPKVGDMSLRLHWESYRWWLLVSLWPGFGKLNTPLHNSVESILACFIVLLDIG